MMCNRIIIKATKFEQSSANRFRTVAKNCLGANCPPPPPNLAISGQMTMKPGKDILWVQIDKMFDDFIVMLIL